MVNAFIRSPKYRVSVTKRGETPIDVTDFVLSVTTSKDLNNFVGRFTLVLKNRLNVVSGVSKKNRLRGIRNIEQFFKPMTYVEIFASTNSNVEVAVMRGFIDSIADTESVGNTSAEDRTSITGSDMGKIFVKQKLFFIVI